LCNGLEHLAWFAEKVILSGGFPGTSFEILSGKAGTFLSLHTGAAGALGTRTLVFLR